MIFRRSILAAGLFLLYTAIAAFYAGPVFLQTMGSAVPAYPVSGEVRGTALMKPGDHFEQLYRYSLPRHNLAAGRPPYESGYQYNLEEGMTPFSEGWVFFPFSVIHTVLAVALGDVFTYNLLALLSFALVGGAMYALVFWLTRSHPAALLASLVLALLPHRTSFLFGEMAYGLDLVFAPLIVLFFEKWLRSSSWRHVVLLGACVFLYATANMQAFYLFSLFSFPYFAVRTIQFLARGPADARAKILALVALVAAGIPALVYALYIRSLIGDSGLLSGQEYSETQMYSPTLVNAVKVWSGNEKTIYIGWPLVAAAAAGLALGFAWKRVREALGAMQGLFWLSAFVFLVSYLFCFGPNLDSMLDVDLYRWYFDHVPGANNTRTPGRLMGTAGFFFALFFGLVVHLVISGFRLQGPRRTIAVVVVTIAAAAGLVQDYHYTRPLMVSLEPRNEAYEAIRGQKGIVYTIPTQYDATSYLNATFLYYAQEYDLRLFTGHSSMYRREWNRIIGEFLPVNDGQFDREMMERFRARGIHHLVAHETPFEPRVTAFAVARLRQSPYLKEVASSNGVHVFKVDPAGTGKVIADPQRLLKEANLAPEDTDRFLFMDGWYRREAYPGETPFRWMNGTYSTGAIQFRTRGPSRMEFTYKCPVEGLQLRVNGRAVSEAPENAAGGWQRQSIDLDRYGESTFYVEISTPGVYTVPNDARKFGCMVGDVALR